MATTQESLQFAFQLHQAGRLPEAAVLYRHILQAEPGNADALHLLGLTERSARRPENAAALILRALALRPEAPDMHLNLGNALRDLGRLDDACDAYRRALRYRPDFPPAEDGLLQVEAQLANELNDRGQGDAAVDLYHRLIARAPARVELHYNLGVVLQAQGAGAAAKAAYRQALALRPDHVKACLNLAVLHRNENRLAEAVALFRAALAMDPDSPAVHSDLGSALQALGRFDAALEVYWKALALQPDFVTAHMNLGFAYQVMGRYDEALAHGRHTLALEPNYPEAWSNLGSCYRAMGRLEEAADAYYRALQLRPDFGEAWSNLATVFQSQGRLDAAVDSYRRALEFRPDLGLVRSNMLFCLNYDGGIGDEALRAEHAAWDEHHGRARVPPAAPHGNDRDPDRRLRVGYVSADFGRHPVGYFLSRIFEHRDRRRIEVYAYSGVEVEDELTARLRAGTDVWRSTLGVGDDDLARQIREDGIDILVDLAGHTARNRLAVFARKPAPVQVSWLGYFNTTGLAAIDYVLMDEATVPPGAERWFTEQVVRLPGGRFCYEAPHYAPEPGPPPCRRTGRITFGSFNNLSKVTPEVIRLWARVLHAVPDARLLLKWKTLRDPPERRRLLDAFAAAGIGPERLELRPASAHPQMFAEYGDVDIALDPFPFCGGLTSCEALWMGVPVVTLPGRRPVSRQTLGFLTALGLTVLAADTPERYVAIAAELARDPERLAVLRGSLRARMAVSPLCDGAGFTHHLEDAYRGMWRRWCRPEPVPAPVPVPAPPSPGALTVPEVLRVALGCHQGGDLARAEALYRRVLEACPDHPDALNLLGTLMRARGQFGPAVELLRRAVAASPDFGEGHYNLGNALGAAGRLEEAIPAYRRAVALRPTLMDARNNLGNALQTLGRLDEALDVYRAALAVDPMSVDTHNNIGALLVAQGRLEAALAAYRLAIAIRPDYPQAHNNLGMALTTLGRLGEAVAAFGQALAIQPTYPEALNNLGNALYGQGRVDEALATYRRALDQKPDYPEAHSNYLLSLNYRSDLTPEQVHAEHRAYDQRHARPLAAAIRPHANAPDPERRLRVGYYSADFRRHSCAYFLEPLFRHHDKRQVEVFCYAQVKNPDAVTDRFKGMADHWSSTLGLRDEDLAERVRADGVDILVDLAGHFAETRLLVFARRPAPVQVTWLGYPNTTGLSAIDYRFVDAITDPEGVADPVNSETLVRLPCGMHCFQPPDDAPEVGPPPARAAGAVTFGSFNNLVKVTPEVVALWAEVLRRVPGSRLLLKSIPLADPSVRRRYLEMFAAGGVAAERIEMVSWTNRPADHLALYNRMDIALDPFPYNGTTTTCEALWMGVPVVSLRGRTHAGRVGASLLTSAGLPELIHEDPAAYVGTAAALAGDLERLAAFRRTARDRVGRTRLCDGAGFARHVEAAYRAMWRRWCAAPRAG